MTAVRDYLRVQTMPHVLCPGCAHGIVLRSLLSALAGLAVPRERLAVVAGIGCAGRLAVHIDACTLHTTHGRAPAFATGVKLARPELTVVVLSGDGDGLAIGGNHLIHAARRDIDLTVLLFDNAIYGMTGGQLAPTTAPGSVTSTAPGGSTERPFDACRLLQAAGATFVARASAYQAPALTEIITAAIAHRGFSFIDVISDCPVYDGRYNQLGEGADMLAGMPRRDAAIDSALTAKSSVPFIGKMGTPGRVLPMGILHQGTE